jgi:hypothetical protein
MSTLEKLKQLIEASSDAELKTQAAALIATAETEVTGLSDEKAALLRKRDELLGKLNKYKKFDAHPDVDIDELLQIKDRYENLDSESKSKYQDLYEKDKTDFAKRLEQIEKERAQERLDRENEQKTLAAEKLKTATILEFSKPEYNVFDPEQLFMLIGPQIRFSEAGKLISGDEYKEVAISDFLTGLKDQPRYQNQFKANGANGSGSTPSQGSGGSGTVNPWKKESFNLTQQGRMMRENPTLAASMKAAAGVK